MKSLKDLLPHDLRQHWKRRLFQQRDVESRLENLQKAGFSPRGMIDGGAYEGSYTKSFWKVWEVPTLLVEPQPSKKTILQRVAARISGSKVITAALGASVGSVTMALDETNSRIVDARDTADTVMLPCQTLSGILKANPDFKPDFVKLDLQGNELKALEGAGSYLKRFEVIQLEVSVIRIGSVPIFNEVETFMSANGFRFYDVVPQYYRPRDGALWQMDVMYVRNDSPLLESNSWD